jgi:carbon monoxide dehydrogenase subunit G
MFIVRADFREDLEIGASLRRVRSFFVDLENFARLMPGVESISKEEGKRAIWTVRVGVPLIGEMRGEFALIQTDDSASRVEWEPAAGEKKNLLRYAFSLEEQGAELTLVRFALRVELRRRNATDLHMMAGLVGERRISAGVQEGVEEMMRSFLKRARAELED